MVEPFANAGQILANAAAWDRLLQSGFFLVDFASGQATPSTLMSSLGYRPKEFLDGRFVSAIHPGDRPAYDSLWMRVHTGLEDEFFAEYRIKSKKGGYRWVQTLCIVLERSPDGRVALMLGLDRDIGLRKQSELLLHSRFLDLERRYLMSESLRAAGSMVTASLDIDNTIAVILEQAETLFPFTGARIWAIRDDNLELMGQEEDTTTIDLFSPATSHLVRKVTTDITPLIIDNLGTRVESGPLLQASWIGIPLVFHGEVRGVMEFWHEESGFYRSDHVWPAMAFADNVAVGLFNARQFRATQEASETDALTGLASRRRLERLGPQLFEQAMSGGHDLTVFMVDLDHFKTVNDTWGHAEGDAVLKKFAQTCLNVMRKGDVMCRYGGDEFVGFLPHTSIEDALGVVRRLRELFLAVEFPLGERHVTLSLGLASLRSGGYMDIKGLIESADAALYKVKARGRDGIEVADI
jgi:diguanylate cyclase (GGDEF)-like protein